jgi:3-hydroxy-9,10-secoandrosta-1,3,5(10)-triene-9,17-dione monooxygenase reductase component
VHKSGIRPQEGSNVATARGVLDDGTWLMAPELADPDPQRLRKVLGHFPTGVAVVTGNTDDGPLGMAINSFTSLSLEPPMVLFCPAVASKTWPVLRSDGELAINILSADQEQVSRAFAGAAEHRFSEVEWTVANNGAPLLADAIAWLECDIAAEFLAGDHTIVIAHVQRIGVNEDISSPLVFFRSAYHPGIPHPESL